MPLPVKQPVNISFSEGLELKTDPKQVPVGKFLRLVNTVFDKVGQLTKRNGFASLVPLPDSTTSYLTTFSGGLQAIGPSLHSFSSGQERWLSKGSTYPIQLDTLSLIRNAKNQSQVDCAISSNSVVCTVFTEAGTYKYALADEATGQNIVAPTAIPVASGVVTNSPRVFLLGNSFIIVFENVVAGAQLLQYVAISSITGGVIQPNTTISSSLANSTRLAFDGAVANNRLYLAWNSDSAGGIRMIYLTSGLSLSTSILVDNAHEATLMSVAVDTTQSTPVVWASYYNSATSTGYSLARTSDLSTAVLAPTQIIASGTILNLTSLAQGNRNTFFYEVSNAYSYDGAIATNFIRKNTLTSAGVLGSSIVSIRSLGLASKVTSYSGSFYYLAAYSSSYQPTYFLVNGSVSTSAAPTAITRLSYGNGGGYLATGLPSLLLSGTTLSSPYLVKDLIQAVNKNTNVPTGTQVNGIYSQTGINLATFDFTTNGLVSAEIGNNLLLSGGFLWGYDGYLPVENNFFLWPDSVEATWSATGGSIVAKPDGSTNTNAYYYQVTYEWADNQGNVYRSAPSIPIAITTTGALSTGSITVNVPTLRVTYKVSSPVKVCIYRWSVAQQSYYQVTSLSSPTINDTTTDSIAFVDTLADSSILGNNLIYTTGGVIENVATPACDVFALFDNRFWLLDSEDRNLLWFSKQVIENVPVEMSDLFTLYVAPSTASEGSTGDVTALYPMDDKLIIFKRNAIYYINGSGPNNTGADNQYSQPTFITSTVGCSNPKSIVMSPQGLMFQSSKGIWGLSRDLRTSYVGAPVESYNAFAVTSAVAIPDSNQVRFGLDNGSMLMFDYYVSQWGTFEGTPSVSSTLYNNSHTIVNSFGQVTQETAGTYLDGTRPVLMSFTTSWLNVAGLRGYIRAYWFYLLGTYLSPHKLAMTVAYDYNESATQGTVIAPINYGLPYAGLPYYGGDGSTKYGGPSTLENWQIFLERQRCKAFQISMQEVFDPTYGTVAGPGLTLSGLSCIVGVKKSWAPISQNQQTG